MDSCVRQAHVYGVNEPRTCYSSRVIAEESLPPFANTAMDGFAVRSSDHHIPTQLRIVETSRLDIIVGSLGEGPSGS